VNRFVFLGGDTGRAAHKDNAGFVIIQIEDFKGQESEPMSVNVKILPK
jgi:hypothetical protein